MRFGLLLIFIAIPLLEIAVLIKVGTTIGFWPTLAIVIATAVAGSYVLHRQGTQAFQRMMSEAAQGRPPIEPVVDGAFLVFAGGLLLSPGLITDTMGLLLLIPPLRRWIARAALKRFMGNADVHVEVFTRGGTHAGSSSRSGSDTVIDGEYERVDEPGDRTKPPGGGGAPVRRT